MPALFFFLLPATHKQFAVLIKIQFGPQRSSYTMLGAIVSLLPHSPQRDVMLVMSFNSVNSQNSKSNAVIVVQRQQLRGKLMFEVSEYAL